MQFLTSQATAHSLHHCRHQNPEQGPYSYPLFFRCEDAYCLGNTRVSDGLQTTGSLCGLNGSMMFGQDVGMWIISGTPEAGKLIKNMQWPKMVGFSKNS